MLMKLIPDHLTPEINLHIDKTRQFMEAQGMDALLVSSNSNIYYTTGRFFRGYVYIPLSGNAMWFVVRPVDIDSSPEVVRVRKPEDIPAAVQAAGLTPPRSVGFEFDSMTYSGTQRLMALFPGATPLNGSIPLRLARLTKTPWEIDRMKEDGMHQTEVYRRVTKCYEEDMTDVQFQIEIERILRLEGCLGFIRTSGNLMDINLGSVIAGDNADNPSPYDFTMGGAGTHPSLPGGADGTTIRPGQTVMVDMNGSFNGYQTDMTRVWCLGEIPRLAQKAHKCSLAILRACEKAKPGTPVKDLYQKALDIATAEKLQDYFMGHRQQAVFIGHGVGIELNEPPVVTPRSRDILQENMTIALEPKFVIPGVGAVGIENTYVVTPRGLNSITRFPEEIQEL